MPARKEQKQSEIIVNKLAGSTCPDCDSFDIEVKSVMSDKRVVVECDSCYHDYLVRLYPTKNCLSFVSISDIGYLYSNMEEFIAFYVGPTSAFDKARPTNKAKEKIKKLKSFILDNCLDFDHEDIGVQSVKYLFGLCSELEDKTKKKLDEFQKEVPFGTAVKSKDPRYYKIWHQ